ncbi:MAG: PKD domain-containing protein [Candidatus Thermoplasmatota archaeon]|nr:PKD domain-containing protein [Candidatus Thermoplasmatota archaeon]
MDKKILFALIAFAVILAPSAYIASDAFSIVHDLEDDDGGMYSIGDIDPWEWGIPGTGTEDVPGPGRSWSGLRCWGSPLNGTYPNGTDSTLYIHVEIDEDALAASVSFHIWFDLSSLLEGPTAQEASDLCDMEYSWDELNWTRLDVYSRTTGGDWVEREYAIPMKGPATLTLRFHLKDEPDGRRGAGVFIDDINIETIPFDEDVISLSDIFIPGIVALGRDFTTSCSVSLDHNRVPQGASVELLALIDGKIIDMVSHDITETGDDKALFTLRPNSAGGMRIKLYKVLPDRSILVRERLIEVVDPIFHESFEENSENWIFPIMDDPSFYPLAEPDVRTPSGGRVAGIATTIHQGMTIGFSGEMGAFMRTAELDMRRTSSAMLHIYHSYSFMGPTGTCGGVVMAHYGNESRIIEPESGYGSTLIDGRSGPIGGIRAFTGEADWRSESFDLSALTGRIGHISFQATSGEEGTGGGWMLDDVMIVPMGGDPNDDTPPDPVTGLRYEVQEGGVVSINWNPSSDPDLDLYRLYLSNEPLNDLTLLSPEVMIEPSATPGFLLLDLEPSQRYHVSVVAVDVWGNMNSRAPSVTFIAPSDPMNSPPVAVIRIEGSDDVRVNEEIVLSASDSFDPDGDTMTFTWTMPDGTVRIGERIRWTPSVAGEGRVMLQARDRWGATNETFVTIEISQDGTSPILRGNLSAFLLMIVPIAFFMLFIIMMIAYLRGSRKRRLEHDLEDVGIVHDPQYIRLEEVERVQGPTVLDLRPANRDEFALSGKKKEMKEGNEGISLKRNVDERQRPSKGTSGTSRPPYKVKMTLECPSCTRKFRTNVDDPLPKGGLPIKCPHCGMRGTI